MIWIGTALTLLGSGGLAWCIRLVLGIKRQALADDQARVAMQRVVAWNMGALAVSMSPDGRCAAEATTLPAGQLIGLRRLRPP